MYCLFFCKVVPREDVTCPPAFGAGPESLLNLPVLEPFAPLVQTLISFHFESLPKYECLGL